MNQPEFTAESDSVDVERQVVRARWYVLEQAAQMLGVGKHAVRQQIRQGTLTGVYRHGRWRVLLLDPVRRAADWLEDSRDLIEMESPVHEVQRNVPAPAPEEDESSGSHPDSHQWESLLDLVRDLQRTNMELAGQVGYLQGQIASMQERVQSLEAPTVTAVEVHPVPELEDVRRIVESAVAHQRVEEGTVQEEVKELKQAVAAAVAKIDERLEYRNLLLYDQLRAPVPDDSRGFFRRLFRR